MTVKANAGASGPHIFAKAGEAGNLFLKERPIWNLFGRKMTEKNLLSLEASERLAVLDRIVAGSTGSLADWLCAGKRVDCREKCSDIGCGLGLF